MGDPILNLSAWIDRRRKEVGPYADHIVHSVKAYEARITSLEEERDRLREALSRQGDNMSFLLNRVTLPDKWLEKFNCELEEDRAALEGE